MTTSFLDALKQKSATQQTNRVTNTDSNAFNVPVVKPERIACSNALAKSTQSHIAIQDNHSQLNVTIDLVLNRNRIDVFFSRKPDQYILDLLNDHCWSYRPTDRAWYNKDTHVNRKFLNDNFGSEIEIPESVIVQPKPLPEIVVTEEMPKRDIGVTEEKFDEHKRKIDALCKHLNIHMTDLIILAVDALYEKTFD